MKSTIKPSKLNVRQLSLVIPDNFEIVDCIIDYNHPLGTVLLRNVNTGFFVCCNNGVLTSINQDFAFSYASLYGGILHTANCDSDFLSLPDLENV